MKHANFSLKDIEIVTTISDSSKSQVYLVTLKKEENKFAILKKHQSSALLDFYKRQEILQSEYFPKLYAIREEKGEIFLLEEYIAGKTLQNMLDDNYHFTEEEITHYMTELCRALQVLHNAVPPIIHRDIKPENVIITDDGHVKLLDFDAAREYKENQEKDTVLLGTKEYASPEQFGFMQTDIRSDIYSLGIVFSELLNHSQASTEYVGKAKQIINHATMFDPNKRYHDVGLLLKDLSKLAHVKVKAYAKVGVLSALAVSLVVLLAITLISNVNKQNSELTPHSEPVEPEEYEMSPIEPIKAVPLMDAFNYVSIEEEVQAKDQFLMENYSYLYNGKYFDDNDSGIYAPNQEVAIGNQLPVIRFLKAYPRDIVRHDNRFEGKTINTVYYCPYLEDIGVDGNRHFLESSDYSMVCGNIISISAEFLQTLDPGMYTFTMEIEEENMTISYGFYLVVHGEEEQVDNFRVHTMADFMYYSSESKNDVVFYVHNTPYPISQIKMGKMIIPPDSYQLVDDGFGVVFSPEFLDQYNYLERLELIIQTANGKQVQVSIINISLF